MMKKTFCRSSASFCLILLAAIAGRAGAQALYPGELAQLPRGPGVTGVPIVPIHPILVDLDNDGDADLVIPLVGSTPASNSLGVSYAVGGKLVAGACYAMPGLGALALAAGDLNGDGFKDVVVVCNSNGGPPYSLQVFLNNGTGGLNSPIGVPIGQPYGTQPYGAAFISDFNGDGIGDILLTSAGGVAQLFLGTGGGTFAAPVPALTTASAHVALVDDDLDGDLDLHEVTGGNFVTHRNNGGAFAPPFVRFATFAPTGFPAMADFNLDGNIDAAVVSNLATTPSWQNIQVALGNGAGAFTPGPVTQFISTAPIVRVDFADTDGDGDLDLVLTSTIVYQAINVGGTFPSIFPACTIAPVSRVAVGDITGDGIADALLLQSGGLTPGWEVFPGTPSKGLSKRDEIYWGSYPHAFRLADVNGDGRLDAIATWRYPITGASTASGISFLMDVEQAPGQVTTQVISFTNPSGSDFLDLVTADLNHDGIVDLLAPRANDLWISLGAPSPSWSPPWAPTVIPLAAPISSIAVADVNGDGNLDVILNQGSSVAVMFGTGNGTFTGSVVSPICPPAGCGGTPMIAAADLNADGFVDLVVAQPQGPFLTTCLGNGTGSFLPISSAPGVTTTSAPVIKDLNGDGIPDVIAGSTAGGISVWLGLGGGAFGPPSSYAASWPTTTLPLGGEFVVGDVNGDGFPDAVFAGGAILLNNGSGGFTTSEAIGAVSSLALNGPPHMAIGDTDRDLQPDLAFYDPMTQHLALYHNLRPCTGRGFAYGGGCAGSGGFVPGLSASGCSGLGGTLTLSIENALGGAAGGVFVVGPASTNVSLGSACHLLVQLGGSFTVPFPVFGPASPGQGRGGLTVSVPTTIPPGTSVAIQAGVLDPAAAFGWSATNGLALTFQ